MAKTAFITGITGQDGYYLSQILLSEGYRVIGLARRAAQGHVFPPNVEIIRGDITEPGIFVQIFDTYKPTEFYHLAAVTI